MFIKAYPFDRERVFYFDQENKKYIARGGSLAWRYNNPGLLHYYDPQAQHLGVIGTSFPYLIFSSRDEGIIALKEWLSSHSLMEIADYYYPNNPTEYLASLSSLNTSSALLEHIIELSEFSCAGHMEPLPQILARFHSNEKKSDFYLVEGDELLTKEEAILRVESHRLDAVIVHQKNGALHLRSRPGHHPNSLRLFDEETINQAETFKEAIREAGKRRAGQCIWGYINGIWNDERIAKHSIDLISSLTSGEKVFSLINNSQGKIKDLLECHRLCHSSPIVKLAAKFFEFLIYLSEREGENSPIILFVHSQGALIANLALDLLEEKRAKKLRIFAFGASILLETNKAHPDSHNYIGEADLIPRLGFRKFADRKKLAHIADLTVLDHSTNGAKKYLEHTFSSSCYLDQLKKIIAKYQTL